MFRDAEAWRDHPHDGPIMTICILAAAPLVEERSHPRRDAK